MLDIAYIIALVLQIAVFRYFRRASSSAVDEKTNQWGPFCSQSRDRQTFRAEGQKMTSLGGPQLLSKKKHSAPFNILLLYLRVDKSALQ